MHQADDGCLPDTGKLPDSSAGAHALIAIQKVPKEEAHLYGIMKGKKVGHRIYRIEEMVEKPEKGTAPSNLAIIGRYILPYQIFEMLEKTSPDRKGEFNLPTD